VGVWTGAGTAINPAWHIGTTAGALGRNANTSEGAAALAGALDRHQDDQVDDVDGFLNNVNTNKGAKMLQHILAGN